MTRRLPRAAALTAGLVALLTACSSSLPEPTPPPAPAVAPAAVTPGQSSRILDDLGTVLTAADKKLDAKLLEPRLEDPALEMREAEYVRADATDGDREPTALPTTAQATIVPRTESWPRTQLVVTDQPADLQAQRILVLRQDDPRAQFKLWGWSRLLPSTQMPPTAKAEIGSPVVAPDSEALVVTPQDAIAQYADVLTKDTKSKYDDDFAKNASRDEINDLRERNEKAVKGSGTYDETYTADDEPVVSLGTIDGGAIVVGRLTALAKTTLTLKGATLPISDPFYRALTGKKTAKKSVVRTSTDVLVLYVPPKGSDAPMSVLAFESVITDAKAS
ncbi:hypothetical protein [Cellulomonas rhizosphaerae]|uniref:DUF8094 domain-containing protein n=1 Tax=Cellulomonas rhizosphaerae TaxID=2293719 RepID=A0A413RRJ4_9CELL|nr:hypothetical protein [Cellulomonas rhizosphaerae]RHA44574.1 hypothetical protein D1825_00520 [Cellulomonas rhizosphaerae]